ncbi:MAG: hypothetical protein IPL79_12995 [Myxococcales bacterium]|nr:hypothetical protein [Myxococcales bacterium]
MSPAVNATCLRAIDARASACALVLVGVLAACRSPEPPAYVPPPPDAALGCADAAAAFAYGFGAATTAAKERGVRDKAYKSLIAAIEKAAMGACIADTWNDDAITCVARATNDEALLACRDVLGAAWAQLEASVDAALLAHAQD